MTAGAALGRQRGAVLVLVLWFLATAAVFAAVMASEARLTAKAAFHNREAAQRWGAMLDALRRAEMELMLTRMPEPAVDQGPLSERRNPSFRFNGQPLETAYPLPDGIEVRIWDHAGKINLNNLSRARMEQLLRGLEEDDDRVGALLDAWQDWIDSDDLKRVNGAEENYYGELDPPYRPRNGRLESVEELLLIKGFDDLLKGVDLGAVFTIHGGNSGINPNIASREALAMLPGMDEETLKAVLEARLEKDLKSRVDLTELVDPTKLSTLLPWLQFSVGNFYTVAVRVSDAEMTQSPEGEPVAPTTAYGYQEIVQARGFQQPPKVLQVRPFGPLPVSVAGRVP